MELTKEELLQLKDLAITYSTEDSDQEPLEYIEKRIKQIEEKEGI